MKTPTIESLRKAGWKVFVKHNSQFHTEIFLSDEQGKTSFGYALCNDKDQPNRKIANKIALGRAIKNYNNDIFCEFSK
jgi:hypothetical protein